MNNLCTLSGCVIHDGLFKTEDEQSSHQGSCKFISGTNKMIALTVNVIERLRNPLLLLLAHAGKGSGKNVQRMNEKNSVFGSYCRKYHVSCPSGA